ncbi:MAG: hypothetical protein JRM82_03380 [Nitrososphaerota archaeon]|nr:hypothetical protein [Nitrososphaerota archaeon]
MSKAVYLTFLDGFQVFPYAQAKDYLKTRHFASFHTPKTYYEFVRESETPTSRPSDVIKRRRFYVKGAGELGSVFRPRNLRKRKFPATDPIWSSLWSFYQSSWKGSPPMLPAIPSIVQYLPNRRRTYKLDLSNLPPSLRTASPRRSRLSISLFYFPLGYAVLCTGVYLESEGPTMDLADLRALNRTTDSFRVVVTEGGKAGQTETLYELGRRLQAGVVWGISGVRNFGQNQRRYMIVDLVGGQAPEPDAQTLGKLLAVLQDRGETGEPTVQMNETTARLPGERGAQDALAVYGSTVSVLQTHGDTFTPNRVRYRHSVRNLATLVMVQQSLSAQAAGLLQRDAAENLTSRNYLRRLIQGASPGDYTLQLTLLHYLGLQAALFNLGDKNAIYTNIRQAMDSRHTIDRALVDVRIYLEALAKRLEKSEKATSDLIRGVLQAVSSVGNVP